MRLFRAGLAAVAIAASTVVALAGVSSAATSDALDTTGSVSGKIVGSLGQPLSGVQVFLWNPAFDLAGSARSVGGGNYTITGVQPGSYYVEFLNSDEPGGPNIQAHFYDNTQVFSDAATIQVTAGQTVNLNQQRMQPGGEVKLRVLGADGHVVPGLDVQIESAPDAASFPHLASVGYVSGTPDANGYVDFQGLLPENYVLDYEMCVSFSCHGVGAYDGRPLGASPTEVRPVGGQVTSLSDVFEVASIVTTTTALSVCPAIPTAGQPVTFTVSVTSSDGSVPSGRVSIDAGSTITLDGVLGGTGTAALTTSGLAVGTTNIYVTYAGSGPLAGSATSTALTVGPATVGGTTSSCAGTAGGGVVRIAGTDRMGTAVAASQLEFPDGGADAVVLARADDYADALVGAPLAAAKHAPLLLTSGISLPTGTRTELLRVLGGGGTVYLLGGASAIPTEVSSELTSMGFEVVRLAGADRYATATDVAGALGNPATVLLATGTNYPDALAAGPAAAHADGAILLTDGAGIPAETAAYLKSQATTTYAIGGPASAADPTAISIQGTDRYSTAADVAARFFVSPTVVGVSTGTGFADALSAGSLLAELGGPLLLTAAGELPASTTGYLATAASTVTSSYVFGGTSAVSNTVQVAIGAALANSG